MYKITVELSFSAAHNLVDYHGDCENIHGHNWRVLVTASFKELPPDGMAVDFRVLKAASQKVIAVLDHKHINNIDYFKNTNPTSENIARYIFDCIKKEIINVDKVTVFETDKYSVTYTEGD